MEQCKSCGSCGAMWSVSVTSRDTCMCFGWDELVWTANI